MSLAADVYKRQWGDRGILFLGEGQRTRLPRFFALTWLVLVPVGGAEALPASWHVDKPIVPENTSNEMCIRDRQPPDVTPAQRLRTHGLVKNIGHTYKYFVTAFGKEVVATLSSSGNW